MAEQLFSGIISQIIKGTIMALKNASKRGGDHVRQRLTSDGQKK